ncbi:hypothetical protein MP228_000730 [Amoeboaphelidium protococcarum]|nr:hypothetical protein MP228_000730 [Amoeboaphelidium protococcarum]
MSRIDGASVIAQTLKQLQVEVVFSVVGMPIVEVAEAIRAVGITFIAFRNEQCASYAANAYAYITGKVGVCLVVGGPGMIHALAGLSNAMINCWPMLLIAGASDVDQEQRGAFQEFPQVEAARLYTKLSARPSGVESIPFYLQKACHVALSGRPGPCYIDIPGNYVTAEVGESSLASIVQIPTQQLIKSHVSFQSIHQCISLLQSARRPLLIIGKGAAYARAESELLQLVTLLKIPFLPTPMGKGTVPDDHELCVAAARSMALQKADVVILCGARLNWILHFGQQPRFSSDVKFIQMEIQEEEIGVNWNRNGGVALVGDLKLNLQQLLDQLSNVSKLGDVSEWTTQLRQKCKQNAQRTQSLVNAPVGENMTYYHAYGVIVKYIELLRQGGNCPVIIGEGANTMDIGRTMMNQYEPRTRLDAGTFGTMGLGLGYAIAAALCYPSKQVICIQGDSAFGFSAMEMETICRYQLPIIVIILNNNGIYSGLDTEGFDSSEQTAMGVPDRMSTSLSPGARYERVGEAFGANGYFVKTLRELDAALKEALTISSNGQQRRASVINVQIEPSAERKSQEHSWLTRTQSKM